ncbi:hypothetical protein [Mycobacterium phage WXIN]|nr:hypothetical protein [Mycobacterium phage WXIN]
MKNWQHHWKAILAFLTLVATNAATDLMQSGNPWPSNGGEWVRFAVSTVGGTLIVWSKRNKEPVDKPIQESADSSVEPVEEVAKPRRRRKSVV